jgi:hypothetical protein
VDGTDVVWKWPAADRQPLFFIGLEPADVGSDGVLGRPAEIFEESIDAHFNRLLLRLQDKWNRKTREIT